MVVWDGCLRSLNGFGRLRVVKPWDVLWISKQFLSSNVLWIMQLKQPSDAFRCWCWQRSQRAWHPQLFVVFDIFILYEVLICINMKFYSLQVLWIFTQSHLLPVWQTEKAGNRLLVGLYNHIFFCFYIHSSSATSTSDDCDGLCLLQPCEGPSIVKSTSLLFLSYRRSGSPPLSPEDRLSGGILKPEKQP